MDLVWDNAFISGLGKADVKMTIIPLGMTKGNVAYTGVGFGVPPANYFIIRADQHEPADGEMIVDFVA